MVAEIVPFLVRSGWSQEEAAYVRHDLPRWERYLRSRGITVIPRPTGLLVRRGGSIADHLFLLMMQAGNGTDPWTEHRQRNHAGVRPYKP